MSENPRHRKLRYKGIDALIHGIQTANDNAQSQRTSNSGSVFIPSGNLDENGQPDGTGTIIGAGANGGGISPWVNDTMPPGNPTGLSAYSKTGMIFVSWDGTINGGVPDDFDHIQVIVDGVDVGWMSAKGTVASGPYDVGSEHTIVVYAYDNAHSSDGKPSPNKSDPSPLDNVIVSGSEVNGDNLGITITKSNEDPKGNGATKGDLWLKYGPDNKALSNEWWWDGKEWVPIPVAIYLDQLAARDVQVDNAVIGMLAAGIIKSGTFVTPDGLVGFDSSGFWVKDSEGKMVFQAGANGVSMTGALETSKDGSRLRINRQYLPSLGRTVGVIEGLQNNDSKWALTGFYDQSKTEVQLSANGHTPNVSIVSPSEPDSDNLILQAHTVEIGANSQIKNSAVSIDSQNVSVQGIHADFLNYNLPQFIGWYSNFEDYQGATRLYKRAGVIFLELNIQYKYGVIPTNRTIPAVVLATEIAPDHSLDVLAYGTSYAVGRFHVFGPNESQTQGTISIGTKDSTANFFSAEMFWADPRK